MVEEGGGEPSLHLGQRGASEARDSALATAGPSQPAVLLESDEITTVQSGERPMEVTGIHDSRSSRRAFVSNHELAIIFFKKTENPVEECLTFVSTRLPYTLNAQQTDDLRTSLVLFKKRFETKWKVEARLILLNMKLKNMSFG